MNGVIKRTVGPSDCALAFAIPLNRKDFLRDLEPTSGKDFVRNFASNKSDILPEVLWELFYRPLVDAALRTANDVSRMGVRVSFDLRISEFTRLLNSAEVVMVVAHWRSARFKPDDIINLRSLVPGLMYSNERVAKILREQFCPELKEQLNAFNHSALGPHSLELTLIKELNRSLSDIQLYQGDNSDATAAQPDTLERRMYFNRLALEETFPTEFIPGNRFELCDGLHSIASVVDEVPIPYEGILDLTTCNSILLGEAIKCVRRNCLILVNRNPTRLDFRLVLYKNVIKELARRNGPYVDVVVRLRKELIKNLEVERERTEKDS